MASLNLVAWIQRLAARIEQLERGVALGNGTISNAKLTSMAEARIKGRAAGSGTGAPIDLTGTQTTAILDVMVGDSGSGGTKGLVPAPAAGDAAAGKFLKADGTFAVPPGTGGSGDSTESTAYGSEVLTGSGDLNFYTNSFYVGRYNGSAWIPWGPIFPCTKPVSGDFSWVNQGGATLDTTYGGMYVHTPGVSGNNLRLLVKTAPSTPYTVTATLIPFMSNTSTMALGLAFRQSSDGKIVVLSIVNSGNPLVEKWTNATTFSAAYTGVTGSTTTAVNTTGQAVFLRIADDGTDRICSLSRDGQHWVQLHTVGRTDFLTADQVGVFVYANHGTATNFSAMTLLSWKEA